MTDYEIDDMQKEINQENNTDVEDGGVDVSPDSDGVRRMPDDEQGGENNE